MRNPLTVKTSSTRTSVPAGRSSRATRAAPASRAVAAPAPSDRLAIVPPVASTVTSGTGTSAGGVARTLPT